MSKEPLKQASNPLGGFKGSRGLSGFYKDVMKEMKHVTWPTRRETTRLTGVVIAVCVAITVLLFALSFGFDTILRIVLRGGN